MANTSLKLSTLLAAGFVLISCNSGLLNHNNSAPFVNNWKENIDTNPSSPNNLVSTLFINVPGGGEITSKEEWTESAEIYLEDKDGKRTDLGLTSIKRRGNSSMAFPKHSYNLKLETKQAILGMPSSKRWCLLAQWMDRTNLRNDVAFEVSRRLDMDWTPRGRFVKLYYNGEDRGLYYLVEKVKIASNRINIKDNGYLIEIDSNYDEVFKFRSQYFDLPVNFKEPDEDVMTTQMVESFKKDFNELEKRIKARNSSYTEMLDLDSFIKWVLVQEIVGNAEYKHPKSVFMYKNPEGKLYAGPVWDFDWGTFVPGTTGVVALKHHWYASVRQERFFHDRLKEIWEVTKPNFATLDSYIDARAAVIREEALANGEQWPIGMRENGDEKLSFDEAVQRMKDALNERIAYLDTFFTTKY